MTTEDSGKLSLRLLSARLVAFVHSLPLDANLLYLQHWHCVERLYWTMGPIYIMMDTSLSGLPLKYCCFSDKIRP